MSYSGSTASSPNPPVCFDPTVGNNAAANSTSIYARSRRLWLYNTSDGSTNLMDTAYFTDGKNLGMKAGDFMIACCASTQSSTGHVLVHGILTSTNSTAGWNLSTGGSITSSFN